MEAVQIFWSPAGAEIPNIGDRAFLDSSDGDTPNIRMPVRMLSVDTPEVTARSPAGATRVDSEFLQLAEWIRNGQAPVSQAFSNYILPKLETGKAGTLQFEQGTQASAWFKDRVAQRLTRPSGSQRNLFIRTADAPFDNYHRLLAYVAPFYSKTELEQMAREDHATFNLDLIESGWGCPFIVFPNIPGESDMPLFLRAAERAITGRHGQWADDASLPAYEYRMCEKLHDITKKMVSGENLSEAKQRSWRDRYAADMRNRTLHGPESYMTVPPDYRLWIWKNDIRTAVSMLNLVPSADLVA